MARAINRLTTRQAQTITAPGKHADGDGLYLIVDTGGAKRWSLILSVRGRRRELGLGGFKTVSLLEAREKAREARKAISEGMDPKHPKQPPPAFAVAAEGMITEMASGWHGRDTEAHWTRSLLTYAKDLADVPVDLITTNDVLRVVRPVWVTRPESGRKLRQRIEALMDYATVKDWRDGANPARLKGHLAKLLPKQKRTVVHRRAVAWKDAPDFMERLALETAMSARAMEWTIFTAAREGMTRHMAWGDIKGDLWTVPAMKMKEKDRGDFRVPLTPQALAVLDLVRLGDHKPGEMVFPGAKAERPMSDMTMDKLLERMKVDATPHGFRSTFRDWAGDATGHPREVAEAALAHVVGDDVERAYRRGDALAKRRLLMIDWSDYLRPRPATEEGPPDE